MALSGKTNVVSFATSGAFQVWLEWSATQNKANNTSTVNAVMYVKSVYSGSGFSSNGCTMTIIIDGQSTGVVTKGVSINNIQTIAVHSFSATVPHSGDGTKTFGISGQFAANIMGWPQVLSTGTFSLDKIPRAYTFMTNVDSVNMDSPLTINIANNGSGYTARLYYHFGNKRLLLNGATPVGTNYDYIFKASDWADQIPSSTSGWGTLSVETWNGGTKIGAASKSIGLTYPTGTAYSPSVTDFDAYEAITTTQTVTGSSRIFVQGLTNVRLHTTATTAHGSPIKEYKWEINGNTITNNGLTQDVNLGRTNLGTGSAIPVKVTVTDQRGRTASKTGYTINIQPYQPPKLTEFSALRKTSPDTTVDIVKTVAVASIKNGTTEKNTYTVTTKYKLSTATEWTTAKTETNTSGNLSIADMSVNSSYDIEVAVTDKFNTISATQVVSTTAVPMHFYKDVGVGVHKMYEEGHGALDVGGDIWSNGRSLLNIFYPVGTIYQSTNSANPSTWMGGTWERFGNGKTLVAVDENDTDFSVPNKIGGTKAHTIKYKLNDNTFGIYNSGEESAGFGLQQSTYFRDRQMVLSQSAPKPFSVVQPYITVYRWRRIA